MFFVFGPLWFVLLVYGIKILSESVSASRLGPYTKDTTSQKTPEFGFLLIKSVGKITALCTGVVLAIVVLFMVIGVIADAVEWVVTGKITTKEERELARVVEYQASIAKKAAISSVEKAAIVPETEVTQKFAEFVDDADYEKVPDTRFKKGDIVKNTETSEVLEVLEVIPYKNTIKVKNQQGVIKNYEQKMFDSKCSPIQLVF